MGKSGKTQHLTELVCILGAILARCVLKRSPGHVGGDQCFTLALASQTREVLPIDLFFPPPLALFSTSQQLVEISVLKKAASSCRM